MTKRESRVIHAFINCVRRREYTLDYAITLIEDTQRYGWLSDAAKEYFYAAFEEEEPEPEPAPEPEEEPEGDPIPEGAETV
jgi:hypothetical protein